MIPIRALQHFLYCPHRWGVLYLEDGWQDNAFTVLADIMHERVHSGDTTTSKLRKVLRNITVYSENLGIYGKADCLDIEFRKGDDIPKAVKVIEYKPTAPKTGTLSAEDRLQLYAQYVCVKELFRCDAAAYVYYQNTRKRVIADFDQADSDLLRNIICNITALEASCEVPKPEYGTKCNGCSLADKCMPRVKNIDVKKAIMEVLNCENF